MLKERTKEAKDHGHIVSVTYDYAETVQDWVDSDVAESTLLSRLNQGAYNAAKTKACVKVSADDLAKEIKAMSASDPLVFAELAGQGLLVKTAEANIRSRG